MTPQRATTKPMALKTPMRNKKVVTVQLQSIMTSSFGNISPRRQGKASTNWLYFMCGTFVGFLASTLFLSISVDERNTAPFSSTTTTTTMEHYSPSSLDTHYTTNNVATRSEKSSLDKGWNNIHVFYGNNMSHIITQAASHFHNTSNPQQTRRWFSQSQQDEFVIRLLRNKQHGYFVDLAANDAMRISNTYALETYFHWKGLCIEANPIYWSGLASYRTNCQTIAAVVGREMMQAVQFKFPNRAPPKGGIVGPEFDNHEASQFGEDQWRYTVTLEHILDRFQAPAVIDYLSLDVEGAETFVLEKFPFDRYRFQVMTIERPDETLCRLLMKHGYRLLKQLKKSLGETVWIHQALLSPDKSSSLIDLSVLGMDTEHYEYSEKTW